MAVPGGRTWAQIASALPSAPAVAPEPISAGTQQKLAPRSGVKPAPVATKAERTTSSPEEAQTAKCVSDCAMSNDLVSAARVDDSSQRSDLSSTAASDRERSESCILCSGSGLLCVGLLKDPCPLCEPAGESIGQERSDAVTGNAASDGSVHEVAASEIEQTESVEATELDKDCHSGAEDTTCSEDVSTTAQAARPPPGTAVSAPPGLGPPGIWVWPHPESKPPTESEESDTDEKTITWPRDFVDSVEVEFICKSAQLCFGSDFIKMTLSWEGPRVQGQLVMPTAKVVLHLGPMAPVYLDFLAPLARLQSVLVRDQALHQCQIFHMNSSKEHSSDSSVDISCAKVSRATCWDVLRKGFCPRPGCTWEHPAPTVANVTWTGGPELHLDNAGDKVQIQRNNALSASTMVDKPSFDLNMGAYDEMDDSSDEE